VPPKVLVSHLVWRVPKPLQERVVLVAQVGEVFGSRHHLTQGRDQLHL
jgi:hypothetical protein